MQDTITLDAVTCGSKHVMSYVHSGVGLGKGNVSMI